MNFKKALVIFLAIAALGRNSWAYECKDDFDIPEPLAKATFEADGFAIGRRGPPLPLNFDSLALTSWATAEGKPTTAQWEMTVERSTAEPKDVVEFLKRSEITYAEVQKHAPQFYRWLLETAGAYAKFYQNDMKVPIQRIAFSLRWWPASQEKEYYRDPNVEVSHQDGGYAAVSVNLLGDRTLFDLKLHGIVIAAPLKVPVEFSGFHRADGIKATWHYPEKPSGMPRFFAVIRFYDEHRFAQPTK